MKAAALLALALPAPVLAQQAFPCDGRESAWSLVEPWEDWSRTFANGDVRVAVIDRVEPAVGSFFLLVLSPPYDELGIRQCRLVGISEGMGYSGFGFEALIAGYDPARGLVLTLPATIYDGATALFADVPLTLVLNQATGEIAVTEGAP